jgi:hypothetical protein
MARCARSTIPIGFHATVDDPGVLANEAAALIKTASNGI